MLRSFDHLARYVERDVVARPPGRRSSAGSTAPGSPSWTPTARSTSALLRALEVEKECYEFTYAATFLPEWMYAPMGGMRWLMERDG